MVTTRKIPDNVKTLLRQLKKVSPNKEPAAWALARISEDPTALRACARSLTGVSDKELARTLAAVANLLSELEAWTDIPASNEKEKTAAKPVAASRRAAIEPPFTDEVALTRCGKVKIFVDGASKGNPGPASAGIVITDLQGKTVFEEGKYLGEMTNNAAEYNALILALEILLEHGAPEAYFFSDSELMVKQINGLYKVRNEGLMPLIREAQTLRRRLPRFQITHIPREQNKRADQLANLAIRQASDAAAL